MSTAEIATIKQEYRNLPVAQLVESSTNPRRRFEENGLKELAAFVSGHKIGLLFRRPFCCRGRGSRMETGGSPT
jgi:hypothetical protein